MASKDTAALKAQTDSTIISGVPRAILATSHNTLVKDVIDSAYNRTDDSLATSTQVAAAQSTADSKIDSISDANDVDDTAKAVGKILKVAANGTDHEYVDESGGTSNTLSEVSAVSTDATKSTYTLSPGIDVDFQDEGGDSILKLQESTKKINTGGVLVTADSVKITNSKNLEFHSTEGSRLGLMRMNSGIFQIESEVASGDIQLKAGGKQVELDSSAAQLNMFGTSGLKIRALGYKSSDGSEGVTQTVDPSDVASFTIKNGLITLITLI